MACLKRKMRSKSEWDGPLFLQKFRTCIRISYFRFHRGSILHVGAYWFSLRKLSSNAHICGAASCSVQRLYGLSNHSVLPTCVRKDHKEKIFLSSGLLEYADSVESPVRTACYRIRTCIVYLCFGFHLLRDVLSLLERFARNWSAAERSPFFEWCCVFVVSEVREVVLPTDYKLNLGINI